MANPQRENGHLDLANEIVDQLAKIRIPGESMQLLWIIFRKTYGFNKREDWIAKSQFVEGTGICKQHVERALAKLLKMNMVTVKGYDVTQKGYTGKLTYSFNKDYETWKALPKKVTAPKSYPKKVQPVPQKGQPVTQKGQPVTQKGAYNNQSTNTNLQKPILQKPEMEPKTEKKRKIPDTDHAKAIEYWHRLYKERWGSKYDFKGDKEAPIIKRLLNLYGLDSLCQIFETFLNTDDEFYRKAGWTLGVLSSQVNKLVQRPILANHPLSKFSEISRHNIKVAQEWLRSKMEEPDNAEKPTA